MTLLEQRALVISELCDAAGASDKLRETAKALPLSEAQAGTLRALTTSRRVTWIAPQTRTWLLERGLITFDSLKKGKIVDLRATELGSQILAMHDLFKHLEPKSKPRKDANW